jgi:transcriptional regulator with XRE-family HTH domain
MPALGEEFRSAREARGLSLSDVAERLHIRSVYLAAIEDEDWKAIGAPVYVRGFMRTYARFLGLDAEDAVARFVASPAGAPPAAPTRADERSRERERERSEDRSSPSLVAILAVLIAIGVVGYVAYSFVQYRAGGSADVPVAAVASPAASAAVADDTTGAALPAPVVTPSAKPARQRGLHVAISQTSWLKVMIDGAVVAEGTYPPGTAKSFTGRQADVVVGNAGGVHITVNGRPVGSLGNSGDVTERRFVLSGE